MRRWLLPLVLACAAAIGPGAGASEREILWRVDAPHSEVRFHLRALGVIGVDGSIDRVDGEVWRDANGSWVELRVPLKRLRMNSAKNRQWALSSEFFDADRHPELRFRAALDGDAHEAPMLIDGSLRLRGIEAPVQVEVAPRSCGGQAEVCRVDAVSEVSRRRFGMRSRRYMVSDKVRLQLSVVLRRP
jgi:polyisoprenoid-binding protein YceI